MSPLSGLMQTDTSPSSHPVVARDSRTSCIRQARAQMDATILRTCCRCQTPVRFVHLHPPELIRLQKLSGEASAYHACLWTAPSITTPAVTYRQIATRSFRARATIAV